MTTARGAARACALLKVAALCQPAPLSELIVARGTRRRPRMQARLRPRGQLLSRASDRVKMHVLCRLGMAGSLPRPTLQTSLQGLSETERCLPPSNASSLSYRLSWRSKGIPPHGLDMCEQITQPQQSSSCAQHSLARDEWKCTAHTESSRSV